MKNYRPIHHTPSREFYVNKLKNNNENLKSKNINLDFLERNLDKLLKYSFKFFHPFFKDDEYDSNKYYMNTKSNLDGDFDIIIEKHVPQWLLSIWNFIVSIYKKIVKPNTINKLKNKAKQALLQFKKLYCKSY